MRAAANGVLRILGKESRPYYTAEDVVELLGVSRTKAYEIIRALRNELIQAGKLSDVYPSGKIPKKYFDERCCCA